MTPVALLLREISIKGRRNSQPTTHNPQPAMLAFVDVDERVSPDHLLRIIEQVVADVLPRVSGDFDRMYSRVGRASVSSGSVLFLGNCIAV